MKPHIDLLETMATFSCTLSCKFCTNYSDYNMRGGYVRWSQMQDWLDVLFDRLSVGQFQIIGGEPFLNPELKLWVNSFRQRYSSEITLKIVTNGTLLHKNMWIIDSMKEYSDIVLEISNHQPHLPYVTEFKNEILKHFDWDNVGYNGYCDEWRYKTLSFQISNNNVFLKTYKNEYGNMKPYNNNPVEAFEICTQQMCPLFVDGKLYKCSTVGMLHRVLKDHNQLDDIDWQPYLGTGLALDCSDEELLAYANNFNKPNPVCRMCPTAKDNAWHNHLDNVTRK